MPYIDDTQATRVLEVFATACLDKLSTQDWATWEPGSYQNEEQAKHALAVQQVNELLPTVAEIVAGMLHDRAIQMQREAEAVTVAALLLQGAA
jgi:hypothetical protein